MLTVNAFTHAIRKLTRNSPMKGWDEMERLFVTPLTYSLGGKAIS